MVGNTEKQHLLPTTTTSPKSNTSGTGKNTEATLRIQDVSANSLTNMCSSTNTDHSAVTHTDHGKSLSFSIGTGREVVFKGKALSYY